MKKMVSYNTVLKVYPDGFQTVRIFKNLVSVPGEVVAEKHVYGLYDSFQLSFKLDNSLSINLDKADSETIRNLSKSDSETTRNLSDFKTTRLDSLKRRKDFIFDIVRSNDWNYFVTLTFDPDKVDSLCFSDCVKKLSNFNSNYKKVDSKYYYLFVPEKHPSSGRFHFHGLIYTSLDDFMIDSGIKSNRKIIYNWFQWKFGFSTATKIENLDACRIYITKYINKINGVPFGQRGFFCSRNLKKPNIFKFVSDDFDLSNFTKIWDTDISSGYELINFKKNN